MNTSKLLELEAIEIKRKSEHDKNVARFQMLAERGHLLRSLLDLRPTRTEADKVRFADLFKELQAVEDEFLDLKEKLFGYR